MPTSGRLDLTVLDSLAGPHIHVLVGQPAAAWEHLVYPLLDSGKVVRELRAHKMRDFGGVSDEFAAALQFPDYYGENAAAFDECLNDLDWLGYTVPGYVIIVRRASELMADALPSSYVNLLDTLQATATEWAKPVAQGAWWDRPGRPFHLVLQETPEREKDLLAKLATAGVELGARWQQPLP